MRQLLSRLGGAAVLSVVLSLIVASAAQAAPAPISSTPSGTSTVSSQLLLVEGHVTVVPSASPQNANTTKLEASWNKKLPALKRALANGESLGAALQEAGLPALTGSAVPGTTTSGGIHPDGASCQDWTCGWKFSAMSSFEIAWMVWAGTISGPGVICLFLGAESAGVACVVAAALWGIVSAYVDFPPSYNPHRCIYIGYGLGQVAKWESC